MTVSSTLPRRGSQLATTGSATRASITAVAVTLVAATAVASLASIMIGATSVDVLALFDATDPNHGNVMARVPRTLLALVIGASLGMAGACLQGLTRNPLADPGILGINAGAAFAMVIAMAWLGVDTLGGRIWFAFLGAALTAVFVHAIASLGRDGATPMKLAIAGAALTAALSSWTSAVLLTDRQTLNMFRFWQVGTVGGREYDVLLTGLPFLAVGAVLALASARLLDALALGDDMARGLGRRAGLDRVVVGVAAVLLAGGATALAGPIAFVGLIVPHALRAVVGSDHGRLIPLSLVGGALLVVVSDVVGRVILPPTEVQVGIMTAAIGVPVFLVMIRRGHLMGRSGGL